MSFSIPTYNSGTPFFTGSFSDPRVIPYTVNLDGTDYPVDLEKYRHAGLSKFREGVVTSGEVSDNLLNSAGGWWRYRTTWDAGAGQKIGDLEEDDAADRFWESRGVDVWEENQVCLLHDTTQKLAVAAAEVHMVATDQYLYVSDGTGVKRSADLTTWNSITGIAGTVQAMATDGSSVYIGTTTDCYTVASTVAASLTSTAGAASYDNLAFVGNRLIASVANVVGELGTSSFTAIYTHFQPAFRWTAIFAVGSRIYFGGYAGNRTELYTTDTGSTGSLVKSAEAATFFAGELLLCALSYGGAVLLGTTEGLRFATLGSDATLQYGPVIEQPGQVNQIAAQGRFAYFTWENFPDSASGVGRAALDQFTGDLTPAFATDVFTEAVVDEVKSVARFLDRTCFGVTADGVYVENTATYVTTGTLDSGEITFGTVEDKSVSSIEARYNALAANETVNISLEDEVGASLGTQTDTTDGSKKLTLDVVDESANRVRVKFTLVGDGTTTPCLTQWRIRAMPIAPPVEEWLVPLIIRSQTVVNDSEGQILSFDPWTESAKLRNLWDTGQVILYKEGNYAFRVRIDNFQIDAGEWRDGSDWFEITCTVRLLSV